MTIRPATPEDFKSIHTIFGRARRFMADSGNPNQWNTTYPPPRLIREDIDRGHTMVCEVDGRIQCVFSVFPEGEPAYDTLAEGAWPTQGPYCAVHRVASRGEIPGIARECLRRCVEQYGKVRIDTHDDNVPMQRTLEKAGFVRCGRVIYENGNERIVYESL